MNRINCGKLSKKVKYPKINNNFKERIEMPLNYFEAKYKGLPQMN